MKKLLKSEICGSINSIQIHCSLKKVYICGRIPPKTRENKKKKKKKKKNKTQTWFMKRESKQRLIRINKKMSVILQDFY